MILHALRLIAYCVLMVDGINDGKGVGRDLIHPFCARSSIAAESNSSLDAYDRASLGFGLPFRSFVPKECTQGNGLLPFHHGRRVLVQDDGVNIADGLSKLTNDGARRGCLVNGQHRYFALVDRPIRLVARSNAD